MSGAVVAKATAEWLLMHLRSIHNESYDNVRILIQVV